MSDEERISDKYNVSSGNVEGRFVDPEGLVLANERGITDLETLQIAEEEGLALAYETLVAEVRTDTRITCELIRHVHHRIFGDLFAWAGRWRTVQISKPGAIWPPPHFLETAMQEFESSVLDVHTIESFADDETFCRGIAVIQGEFLAIHPFREGNARAIKLVTNLLALQSGRPMLVYDSSDEGRDRYILAAKLPCSASPTSRWRRSLRKLCGRLGRTEAHQITEQSGPRLLAERWEPLDHTVPLDDVENATVTLGILPEIRGCLPQGWTVSEFRHTAILARTVTWDSRVATQPGWGECGGPVAGAERSDRPRGCGVSAWLRRGGGAHSRRTSLRFVLRHGRSALVPTRSRGERATG